VMMNASGGAIGRSITCAPCVAAMPLTVPGITLPSWSGRRSSSRSSRKLAAAAVSCARAAWVRPGPAPLFVLLGQHLTEL